MKNRIKFWVIIGIIFIITALIILNDLIGSSNFKNVQFGFQNFKNESIWFSNF